MKTLLKTVCENVFHTQENGNLNIIGIFENILSGQFPAIHPQMFFVLIIEGKPNQEIEYYPIIEAPDGKIILDGSSKPTKAKLGENGKIHITFRIIALKLPGAGKYKAKLYAGDLIEEINFEVQPTGTAT